MIGSDVIVRAGRIFRAVNVLHSVVYFAPEADQEYVAVGLRPGRMGYFASRSAPMGAVGTGAVAAAFYGFNIDLVARHIPRAWKLASPEQVIAARWRVADRTLRRLLGPEVIDSAEFHDATVVLSQAARRCRIDGRPLFAGHAGLEWPAEPHLTFWHAITLLREHRGDGHIAALLRADLSGIESLVTHTATGRGMLVAAAKKLRMWSDEQWDGAEGRLRDRGLLDRAGRLTADGTALRAEVESETDRMSAAPWAGVDLTVVDGLIGYGKSLTRRVLAAGGIPEQVFAA